MDNKQPIEESSSKEGTVVIGVIVEALPNALFKVSIGQGDQEKEILAYVAGKMRLNRIRVLVGDRVEVILDPYGGRGRIRRRL